MEWSKLSENGTSARSPAPVPGTASVSQNTKQNQYKSRIHISNKTNFFLKMCCHKKEISAVQLNFNLDINLFNVTIYYLNFIKVLFGLSFKKIRIRGESANRTQY